jgi:hypothetical protein
VGAVGKHDSAAVYQTTRSRFRPTEILFRLAQVLQLLLASTEAEEEVRGVLAECLGHLALLDPGDTLPALQTAAAGDSPAARAAVRTAVLAVGIL